MLYEVLIFCSCLFLHVIMTSLTHTVYIMVSLLGLLISSLSYTTISNGIRKACLLHGVKCGNQYGLNFNAGWVK